MADYTVITNPIGYWALKKDGRVLHATLDTLHFPDSSTSIYAGWTDEMIVKYEHLINWKLISFLPNLSKEMVEKYSDRLDMEVIEFFNENI